MFHWTLYPNNHIVMAWYTIHLLLHMTHSQDYRLYVLFPGIKLFKNYYSLYWACAVLQNDLSNIYTDAFIPTYDKDDDI